jgi:signal transduction histidine kinase
VIDTGSGMSKEVRESAFEPFFTTKPVGQGSGLGLSQVYGFIKQSHGHVALQSVEGQGTTVSLYLRALPEAKLRPSEAPVQRGQPRLRDGGPEAFAFG